MIHDLSITADDPDLKAGIMSLANLLKIPEHEDPLLRLHVSYMLYMLIIQFCDSFLYLKRVQFCWVRNERGRTCLPRQCLGPGVGMGGVALWGGGLVRKSLE